MPGAPLPPSRSSRSGPPEPPLLADGFDYRAAWYPLAPLEDLDPAQPAAVELLGRRYVIWRPPGEGYRVFLDLCPHRLAPLSEGRLDPVSGQLMCSYHGWCFDGDGLCRRIPQASPPEPGERQARHLAATAMPVREAVGLLWLWPDGERSELAAATPLPLSAFARAEEGFRWGSIVRDLPYDWTTLVENVADPAHVPFAHHGVQGRRERAMPLPMRMVKESRELLEAQVAGRAIAITTRLIFQPPCLLEYRFQLPGERRMGLITYCLPVAPGRSRVVALFSHDWTFPWWMRRPRWWDHLTNRNEVLDGDLLMLDRIERELARRRAAGEPADWRQAYRLPTAADRMVIAFHHWLERYGAPPWKTLLPAGPHLAAAALATVRPAVKSPAEVPPLEEALLDRYHQHTVHCASCRGALAVTQRLEVAGLVMWALGLGLAALLPEAWRLPLGLPLVLLALGGGAAAAALRWGLEPWFRFRPYRHAKR
ncbi:MAG: Rieske 2Fe-2S domain-containing protein [Cyanobacteriota bacterium]|nr:Rieske 2Fe-2S domain-containing protein [Cyanobacteriota bacterium]